MTNDHLAGLYRCASDEACPFRQVLKLYAWEPSFEQQVLDIRNQEIRVLRKTAFLNAFSQFMWSCAPFAVSSTARSTDNRVT